MSVTGILKNYLVFGSGQVVNLITPFIVAPIVISVCGLNAWGQVGVVMSILNILCLLIDFGSLLIGVKEISLHIKDNKFLSKYISTVYLFRVFACLFLMFFYFISIFLFDIKEKELYLLSSLFFFSQLLSPLWIYQGKENYGEINRIIVISKFLYILLVYLIVTEKNDYIFTFFLFSLSNIVVYFYYLMKIKKEYRITIKSTNISEVILKVKKEFPIFVNNFFISIYVNSPIILVNYLLGETYAGVFKLIEMFLSMMRSYLSVFFSVSFPRFCNIFSENKNQSILFLRKINFIHMILLTIGLIVFSLSLPYLYNFLKLDSALIIALKTCTPLVFVPLIIAFATPFYQVLIVNDQQKKLAILSIIGAVLTLLLVPITVNFFRIYGILLSIYVVELMIAAGMIFLVIKNNYLRYEE